MIKVSNEWEPEGKVYNNVGAINGRQYWVTDKNAIWFKGLEDWMSGLGCQTRTQLLIQIFVISSPLRVCSLVGSKSYTKNGKFIFDHVGLGILLFNMATSKRKSQ